MCNATIELQGLQECDDPGRVLDGEGEETNIPHA